MPSVPPGFTKATKEIWLPFLRPGKPPRERGGWTGIKHEVCEACRGVELHSNPKPGIGHFAPLSRQKSLKRTVDASPWSIIAYYQRVIKVAKQGLDVKNRRCKSWFSATSAPYFNFAKVKSLFRHFIENTSLEVVFAKKDVILPQFQIKVSVMASDNIEIIAKNNQQKALQVIEKSGVRQAWEAIGATVNQVGSMAMGLLMKHRDIDFHIYTDKLDVSGSFKVLQKICANPSVTRMEYRNLADTEEACLEFHVWFMLDNEEWQIDMIQILKGSQFDGFFEHVAERINAVLTPETRRAILELKYLTPDDEHIMGIEYYQAVISDGIRNYHDFTAWRKNHPADGIITWCP